MSYITFTDFSNLFKKSIVISIVVLLFSISATSQTEILEELKKELQQVKNEKNFNLENKRHIDILNKIGYEIRFFNTDSLLSVSQKALKYSKASGYKIGESTSLMQIGRYYSDNGDSKNAIIHFEEALKIASTINDPKLILRIQHCLAGEYVYMGRNAKALNIYLKNIEEAKKNGDTMMLSIMTESIASLYLSQKDYTNSLAWYKKVEKINDDLKNPISIAETMSNMASLYNEMGKYDLAMFTLNRSIATFEDEKILDWLAYAYTVKGDIYLKQKKYTWALHWYNQSTVLHKTLNDERARIDLLSGLAKANLGIGKNDISKKYAIEGYEIAKKIKALEGQKDCAEILYEIEKKEGNYDRALNFHEIFQQLSNSMSKDDNEKNISMLKAKIEYEQQKESLIAKNNQVLEKQQSYIKITLLILIIFMATTLSVYTSKKTQKKLNKELKTKKATLEKREVELTNINETKDKLFSIIAHDLRGPIGAFQGLLQLFKEGEIKKDEFLSFIPKLRADINHISFTLNNLLSWGQTQMNGSTTKPSVVPLENLVTENINLLSEIAENKSIKLISKVPENTLAWSDANQIDIVIRNLISNALKFTPENGMVTIDAQERNNFWEISVRDSGVGMQKEIQDKIFEKNSNITTYGTNNEKGTGLGLVLCKEMVENNKGEIWVDSMPRKGSIFYFTLPKAKAAQKYDQAS